ncbi:MAG: MBL fold metallo-hydrolase [Actinomycetia bacterium]|nr:MBL fold metallo-hydrolase [Actinomycetes bacterium]MCP5035565.1 MBL fold metallo-hydrolase [Actinomycetes bacterium]
MSGHGHDHDHGLDPPRVEEVADRVFAYIQPDGTWFINNAGFMVADDGIVAVDTCSTERRTRAFLDAANAVSDAPVRTVVNTHHHGDHTHGNYLTHPATIIAHENCREVMVGSGIQHYDGIFEPADWGDLELAPPTVTFTDQVNVWVGDLKVELHYIGGAAHTTNDVVAWVPERRTLFSGDLVFNGGTPFVVMGSVAGSFEALDRMRQFDAEVIVPGHGPVCTPAIFNDLEAYYRFVQEAAAEAKATGTSALYAARQLDLGAFAELTDAERIVGNLHRAMYELDGGEHGGPMDVAAAIADMVTFNGGRPLRCLA